MVKLSACRLCLATDVKLFNMLKEGFMDLYEMLLGTQISENDGLPEGICAICSTLLLKYSSFRERCNNSQALLKCVYWRKAIVTLKDIQGLDRDYHNLKLPLACKSLLQIDIIGNLQIDDIESPRNIIKEENDSDDIRDNTLPDGTLNLEAENKLGPKHNSLDEHVFNGQEISLATNSDDEPLSRKLKSRTKKPENGTVDSDNESVKSGGSIENIFNRELLVARDDTLYDKQKELCFLDSQFDIIILTKEQQMEELLARKKSHNYLNSSYRCEQCYKGFITQTTYLNHMQTHDPSSGEFACGVCGLRRRTANLARAHLMQTHQYNCVCRLCGHVMKSRNRAREHARWHQGHLYPCAICGLSFTKPTSLLSHMRTRHAGAGASGASAHECTACGDAFVTPLGLSMHTKRAHPVTKTELGADADVVGGCDGNSDGGVGEKRACAACGARFRHAAALRRHVALARCSIADTQPNQHRRCVECGESCTNGSALRRHMLERHPPQVHCPQCDKVFGSERSMESHRRHAHANESALPPVPLCCERCGWLCKSKIALQRHQRVHTGEKPFACSRCPKRFSSPNLLQIHTRTHTDERPYACGSCPRAFRHKAALNRHTRVHTGARPYACAHCPRSFSQSNSCKLHVRTVHLKLPPPYRRHAASAIPATTGDAPA